MRGNLPLGPGARTYRLLAGCCAAAFALLALAATLGWLRPFDRATARPAYADSPCALRQASAFASLLFAGEPSLLVGGIGAAALSWRRRPALAAWLLALLLATVAVETACKHLLDQPSPSDFVATLARRPCVLRAAPGPGGVPQAVSTALPSAAAGRVAYLELASLPSGYAARAAYFCLVAAAAIATRRPRLYGPLLCSALALAATLGATRVVIAWHWPSDVVAGLLLGCSAACVFLDRHVATFEPRGRTASRTGEAAGRQREGPAARLR